MSSASPRLRLTVFYAGLSMLLGAGLLAVSYAVVRDNFDRASARRHVEIESTLRDKAAVRGAIRVRIAPGLPEETAPQVLALSRRERAAYTSARQALLDADERANDDAKQRVLLEFLAALVGVALLSVLAGWVIAGRVLRPLDAALAAQRRFVADASHELRTPLTVVRTEIDVTLADPDATTGELREMAGVVRDANERMERLIDALLDLATSGAGALTRQPLDLATTVTNALRRETRVPDDIVVSTGLEPAPAHGDPVLVERLVANLVDNAGRYNVPGGWVVVRTRADGGVAELTVTNSGPQVAAEDVAALFEPFRRAEPSRSRATGGYGLGLAVVRAVAEAHGGAVTAAPLPDGGLRVVVRLPASPPVLATAPRPVPA